MHPDVYPMTSDLVLLRVTLPLSMKGLIHLLTFSLQAFDALLQKLQKYVPYESSVSDLYAGAGVIGLSLAATRKCRQDLDGSKPIKFYI